MIEWTIKEEEELKSLLKKGFSRSNISRIMERSNPSIVAKMGRMGLKSSYKRPIKVKMKPKIKEAPELNSFLEEIHNAKTLYEIKRNECVWKAANGWCGHPTNDNESYCKRHSEIVYNRPRVPK